MAAWPVVRAHFISNRRGFCYARRCLVGPAQLSGRPLSVQAKVTAEQKRQAILRLEQVYSRRAQLSMLRRATMEMCSTFSPVYKPGSTLPFRCCLVNVGGSVPSMPAAREQHAPRVCLSVCLSF